MFGLPLLPRTLEASVRDVSSERPEVRVSAIADLVRHARLSDAAHARAVPLLEARLTDPHAAVRSAAAVALGDLGAREAIAALVVAMEDADANVREMAINALGEIADARALPRLRRALRDARPEVRYQAVIAFTHIAERAEGLETSEVHDVLFDAVSDPDDAISHIALRIAEERLDAGHRPEERLLVRARALVREDSDASSSVMLVAAILLAKAGDRRGHPLLLSVVSGGRIKGEAPALEDERAAVELVGQLGLEEATPHLVRRAWGVTRWFRDTCAFHARIALARLGHARARAEILRELRSKRSEVLAGAIVSAGRARILEARDILRALPASSVDPELRREALAALAEGSCP
jgi:HEAT repeat protein